MGPYDEGEEANREHGENERFVAPDRFAAVVAENFRDDAHARTNQNAHFPMRAEPEQMLQEERASAAADVGRFAADEQAGGKIEACVENFIHELHHRGGFERRESEEKQEASDELRPNEKR